MAEDRHAPHSLRDQSADQIRNQQRGGDVNPADPERDGAPEGNATMRRLWSGPGGEAHALRNATIAAGTKADGHEDLTAAETPEATQHLSDASLGPDDRDATAEAIARMASGAAKKGP